MIKLYFLGVIGLLIAVYFGLDWYMSAQKLSWEAIWIVWPLWALLTFTGFLLGGAVLGVVAQYAFARDSKELEAQQEADKATYKKSLDNDIKEEKDRLERQEKAQRERAIQLDQQYLDKVKKTKDKLKEEKREAKAAIKAAAEKQADAERLIIETQAENEKHRKSAFNATKTVERIRRRQLKDQTAR